MEVYLIYIKMPKIISKKYFYIIEKNHIINRNGEFIFAFYAFTNNKKYANKFLKTRKKNLFYIKRVYMKKGDFIHFKNKNFNHELKQDLFGYSEIVTFIEYIMCRDYYDEIIAIFLDSLCEIKTDIFSDKYEKILYENGYMEDYNYFGINDFYTIDKLTIFSICYRYLLSDNFFHKIIKENKK